MRFVHAMYSSRFGSCFSKHYGTVLALKGKVTVINSKPDCSYLAYIFRLLSQ